MKQTEAQFQAVVIEYAELHGWRVYHTHDSRRSQAGFPDLTMVRAEPRLIFAELKSEGGKPTDEQTAWLLDLDRSGRGGRGVFLAAIGLVGHRTGVEAGELL